MSRKLKIIEAMSELGGAIPGASLGAGALRVAAAAKQDPFFTFYDSIRVPHSYNDLFKPFACDYFKHGEAVVDFCKKLSRCVSETVMNGDFPFVITGDHSSAMAIGGGLKSARPDKPLGIVWIDAHFDIHSPFTTDSGNPHGMPMAALLDEDNARNAYMNRFANTSVISLWKQLKRLGGDSAAALPEHAIYVGARDYETQEAALVKEKGILSLDIKTIREKGIDVCCDEIIDRLKGCQIYISFDVDSIDKEIIYGTGTPVAKGLLPEEVSSLLRGLIKKGKDSIACLEITEINPTLDCNNQTARTAFDIVKEALTLLGTTKKLTHI